MVCAPVTVVDTVLHELLYGGLAVSVPLNRTFSVCRHSGEMSEEDFDYREWVFMRDNTGLFWSDLLKKRVVVIRG